MSVIRTQSQFFPFNPRKIAVGRVAAEVEQSLDLVSLSQESLKELQGSANSDQNPWQDEELLEFSDELLEEEDEVEETFYSELAQNFGSFSVVA